MENKTVPGNPTNSVTNVFRNGRMPTKEAYTNVWIQLINQVERSKTNQQISECNEKQPKWKEEI